MAGPQSLSLPGAHLAMKAVTQSRFVPRLTAPPCSSQPRAGFQAQGCPLLANPLVREGLQNCKAPPRPLMEGGGRPALPAQSGRWVVRCTVGGHRDQGLGAPPDSMPPGSGSRAGPGRLGKGRTSGVWRGHSWWRRGRPKSRTLMSFSVGRMLQGRGGLQGVETRLRGAACSLSGCYPGSRLTLRVARRSHSALG